MQLYNYTIIQGLLPPAPPSKPASGNSKNCNKECRKLMNHKQIQKSRSEVFLRKGVLKICRNLQEKTYAEVQVQ